MVPFRFCHAITGALIAIPTKKAILHFWHAYMGTFVNHYLTAFDKCSTPKIAIAGNFRLETRFFSESPPRMNGSPRQVLSDHGIFAYHDHSSAGPEGKIHHI